jgi:hypothetical protein
MLWTLVSTLNTVVKNVQCWPFSEQQTLLKCLPLKKLESALAAWFKQVSVMFPQMAPTSKRRLYTLLLVYECPNLALFGWINGFNGRRSILQTAYQMRAGV